MTPAALKRLRARLGLTQQALAERIGVQRNAIARWEMSRRSPHARAIPPMAARLLAQLAARPDG